MRRIATIALAAGVAVGLATAVAIPRDRDGVVAPGPPRVAPERAAEKAPDIVIAAVPGTARVELERDDPHGGPAWVVRSLTARVTYPEPGARDFRELRPCVQLLRRHRGRLGWIDGDNVFRPVVRHPAQAPLACAGPGPRSRAKPVASVVTLLTRLSETEPEALTTAVFGSGGEGARRAELRFDEDSRRPELSQGGAFLEFVPAGSEPSSVGVEYPGRRQTARKVRAAAEEALGYGDEGGRPWTLEEIGEVPEVQVLAPDPNGGPPWAVGAMPDGFSWCLAEPARIVDDRLLKLDFELGTAELMRLHEDDCPPGPGGLLSLDDAPITVEAADFPFLARTTTRRGPVERRTLPGTSLAWGTAKREVRSLTVTTPRDVRTVVPSGPARAWLVVYDGIFASDESSITAHYADGRSEEVLRSLGPGF